MNSTTETVLRILRASLFDEELFLLPDVNWPVVFAELSAHTVRWLPGNILAEFRGLDEQALKRWKAEVLRNMRRNYHILAEQEELIKLLKPLESAQWCSRELRRR